MKVINYISIAIILVLSAEGNLTAQDIKGGSIKYQHTAKYNFDKIFDSKGDAGSVVKEWLAALPKKVKNEKVLYFTKKIALYEDGKPTVEVLNKKLLGAIEKASYFKMPEPNVKRIYYDLEKNELTQQIIFMTREFVVSDQIKRKPWKLTGKQSKVLKYNCMSAEFKDGENTITAWFTPEIPVSVGPDEFFGLPGLVLAIEVNGELSHVATSIDLTPPKEVLLSKPDKGRKVDRKEFEKIVTEKLKEYRANMKKTKKIKK